MEERKMAKKKEEVLPEEEPMVNVEGEEVVEETPEKVCKGCGWHILDSKYSIVEYFKGSEADALELAKKYNGTVKKA